jgi:type I restriction enzyme S subunit
MKIQHSYWETVSTGSTYPSITKTNLQNLPIALPPRDIQDEIVSKLEKVEEKTDDIYQAVTRMDKVIDSLSDAILEKAFKGELSNGSPQPESDWAKESQSSLKEF